MRRRGSYAVAWNILGFSMYPSIVVLKGAGSSLKGTAFRPYITGTPLTGL